MEKSRLKPSKQSAKRLSRFAIAGIFNTGLDFAILNALVFSFHMPKIGANIISSSVAMAVSYLLNHHFVFEEKRDHSAHRFVVFIVITAVGLYGLQNLVIFIFSHTFTAPAHGFYNAINWLLPEVFSKEFVELNFAKALATLASLTWNYLLYSRFVFSKDK